MNNDFLSELIQHHTIAGGELARRLRVVQDRHVGMGVQTDEELNLQRGLDEHNTILNRLFTITRNDAKGVDAASWETACATLFSPETYQAVLEYAHLIANNKRIMGLFTPPEKETNAKSLSFPGVEPDIRPS